jgi:hypothetical protein
MDIEITGRTAELILNAAVGDPMTTAIYEGLCAGNTQAVIRGAAVCYAPTLGLLRRAAAENRNLLLSREHPYFLHGGLHYSYTSGGLEAAMKEDPVGSGQARDHRPQSISGAAFRRRVGSVPAQSRFDGAGSRPGMEPSSHQLRKIGRGAQSAI